MAGELHARTNVPTTGPFQLLFLQKKSTSISSLSLSFSYFTINFYFKLSQRDPETLIKATCLQHSILQLTSTRLHYSLSLLLFSLSLSYLSLALFATGSLGLQNPSTHTAVSLLNLPQPATSTSLVTASHS